MKPRFWLRVSEVVDAAAPIAILDEDMKVSTFALEL